MSEIEETAVNAQSRDSQYTFGRKHRESHFDRLYKLRIVFDHNIFIVCTVSYDMDTVTSMYDNKIAHEL